MALVVQESSVQMSTVRGIQVGHGRKNLDPSVGVAITLVVFKALEVSPV